MNKKKCNLFLIKSLIYGCILLVSISSFLINRQYLELDGNEFLWLGHVLAFMICIPASTAFIIRYLDCIGVKTL